MSKHLLSSLFFTRTIHEGSVRAYNLVLHAASEHLRLAPHSIGTVGWPQTPQCRDLLCHTIFANACPTIPKSPSSHPPIKSLDMPSATKGLPSANVPLPTRSSSETSTSKAKCCAPSRSPRRIGGTPLQEWPFGSMPKLAKLAQVCHAMTGGLGRPSFSMSAAAPTEPLCVEKSKNRVVSAPNAASSHFGSFCSAPLARFRGLPQNVP
mmetsp:Transcript_30075/g.54652  ORF Transcript_30075/g.54652 Transcript_30075/m.54652 type:complete len:208 (+) Transcript_30075:613-1236(+)